MTQLTNITGPIRLPLEIAGQVDFHQLYYFEHPCRLGKIERWVAVIFGEITQDKPIPLRIESACFFGHVFHSKQCDCGYQLMEAFAHIREKKCGLVIYGVDQDARGLGIASHFCIYDLRQNKKMDTEDVFKVLNADLDNRSYEAVEKILHFLGLKKIQLLSNNPHRISFLENAGFNVVREVLEAPLDRFNMATMMLEKEDLGYEWSFKTHADWLAPLQLKVDGDLNRYAGRIVSNNMEIIAEWVGDTWDVANHLKAFQKAENNEWIVYLTDLPRIDEIAVYASMGIFFIVVPVSEFPKEWTEEAKKQGVKLQDWARENRYSMPRPPERLLGYSND